LFFYFYRNCSFRQAIGRAIACLFLIGGVRRFVAYEYEVV